MLGDSIKTCLDFEPYQFPNSSEIPVLLLNNHESSVLSFESV